MKQPVGPGETLLVGVGILTAFVMFSIGAFAVIAGSVFVWNYLADWIDALPTVRTEGRLMTANYLALGVGAIATVVWLVMEYAEMRERA